MAVFFIGVVGLSEDEYYNLSLFEAACKQSGYYQRIEIQYFHPARFNGIITARANGYKGTASQLWPLSMDDMAKRDRLEYMERHREALQEWANKWPTKIGEA